MVCHHWGPVNGLHLQPLLPEGLAKKKKEGGGTETKHYTLLLSLPWEHTCLSADTAKCSGQCLDA